MIRAILLIPLDGGLLSEDSCGGRPPQAWLHEDGVWRTPSHGYVYGQTPAIVLAWDGKVLPIGCGVANIVHAPLQEAIDVGDARYMCRGLALYLEKLGTLVAVGEHGKEIALG